MLTLPSIFSNNCILERNAKIWGYAPPGEPIKITFRGREYKTQTNRYGEFKAEFDGGDFGGPFKLQINDIEINDVFIGYVWLCSGQSNMEMPVNRIYCAFEDELADVALPELRAYIVEKKHIITPGEADIIGHGKWLKAVGSELLEFYAAAFFFGRLLYKRLGVPIGLVCCAAGGSDAAGWLSPQALRAFPRFLPIFEKYSPKGAVQAIQDAETAAASAWFRTLDETDAGVKGGWHKPEYIDSEWQIRELTEPWKKELCINGSIWFRKIFNLPENAKNAVCHLGCVVDSDFVYINGEFIGRVEYRYPPSVFPIPDGILKAGENIIAVRVLSHNGIGGFVQGKDYKITYIEESGACSEVSLDGMWRFCIGQITVPCPTQTAFWTLPCAFYHGMLRQIFGYCISGVIWYQGETNTGFPDDYNALMEAVINEWRGIWGDTLPFITVQLAGYEEQPPLLGDSNWARLREQQTNCLTIPRTEMITAVDCGEANDLHPLDKKTVGERLAYAALCMVYGGGADDAAKYKSLRAISAGLKNGVITIDFEAVIDGLIIKKAPCIIEIETTTGGLFSLPATISACGLRLIAKVCGAWADKCAFVRYAWANAPVCNIFNKQGVPALPFRLEIKQ